MTLNCFSDLGIVFEIQAIVYQYFPILEHNNRPICSPI